MDPVIRKMLIGMGMDENASDTDARAFAKENGIAILETGKKEPGKRSGPTADDERLRVTDIMAVGEQYDVRKEATAAINDGITVDEFKCRVLETKFKAESVRTAEIGMGNKEIKQYSFCRAIMAQLTNDWRGAEFEQDVSKATAKHMRTNAKGFFIPMDVMTRATGATGKEVAAVRDLVVGTPTTGGNLVATDLLAGDFITMLRNAMVLAKLGVRYITGLTGNIAIPRQTGGAAYYFVAEQGAPTKSNATFDQIGLTPKTIAAKSIYSRLLLLQSSIGIEQFVRWDLAQAIAAGIEYGALLGTGADGQPTGVLNTANINNVNIGTNGGPLTWPNVVAMETEVADDNVIGAMAYLTNARVRGKLKTTQMFDSTNGVPIWQNGSDAGDGTLNGYNAAVSGIMPKDGTKGTGTNLSSALFGKWDDLVIGMWGALDLTADPYTEGDAGNTVVRAFQSFDVALRRLESFCKITDITTA